MPDPEPKEPVERRLPSPTQCVLWQAPELAAAPDRFGVLETFLESSHQDRLLLRCRECGQLYFYEWSETIDWEGGDDSRYATYVPVQTPAQGEALKDASNLSLFVPRLEQFYGTAAKAPRLRWIGK